MEHLQLPGATYEIVVRGRMGANLLEWFDDLEVRDTGPGGTCFRGWFPDQPALEGVLVRLVDLGLELSSVRRLPGPGPFRR